MRRQVVKFSTNDNFILEGDFTKIEDSVKGVILAHGMTVNRDDEGIFVRAESKLNELGFSTLKFDFRGHGKSQGDSLTDFTISGELRDLEAAVNFMKDKNILELNIAGASFGGSVSALYAGTHAKEVRALFLANPVLDYEKCFLNPTTPWAKEHFENVFERLSEQGFIRVGSRRFKIGKRLFEEMKIYSPCQELKKYKNPLLIVHGSNDSKVSYKDTLDCFNALSNSSKRFEFIEGSEHGFHEEPYESKVVDMIVKFFSN